MFVWLSADTPYQFLAVRIHDKILRPFYYLVNDVCTAFIITKCHELVRLNIIVCYRDLKGQTDKVAPFLPTGTLSTGSVMPERETQFTCHYSIKSYLLWCININLVFYNYSTFSYRRSAACTTNLIGTYDILTQNGHMTDGLIKSAQKQTRKKRKNRSNRLP